MSPKRYLLLRRMAFVRRALRAAVPDAATVTDIATRYGFWQLGRLLQPGMARVWVLRQPSSPGGNIAASDLMVFVNGSPLARSAEGTAFFHGFQPGTYGFAVQSYGTPTNYVDTLQLTPGTEAYVQVEPVPNWEVGSTSGGGSFIVATMSPQEAQAYMSLTKTLGQR